MEQETINFPVIIRPATIFAFVKVCPLLLASIGFLFIAYRYFPAFMWLSFAVAIFACYRFVYIKNTVYEVTDEVLKFSRGIFFKRTDTVELFRIKDYILTRPFLLQLLGLMDLTLKTTDPENPIIWLRGIPFSNLVDTIRINVLASRRSNKIVEIN
jgi:uncharacterized membrane protein YdbT with pleckstrin-like domain